MAGISIISEFDLKKKAPLDSRLTVADSTARLALTWYFKGLIVRQIDTGKKYEYIGDETTNISGDWVVVQKVLTGTGAPSSSLGIIDDIYIDETAATFYKKTGVSTWTSQFSTSGSKIYAGTTDPPSNGTGLNGDIFYVSVSGIVKLYQKVTGAWVFQFNISGSNGADGDLYSTSSATSINLTTAAAALAITVGVDLAYTIGQQVIVASTSVPADKLTGYIDSYDSGTGAMVLSTLVKTGTATHADWEVNLNGAIGRQGRSFTHTEYNITLTQAKIDAVEAGSWTNIIPWSASILNDTRSASELVATVGLEGSKIGYSINWDGASWTNNGLWRGPKGEDGDDGIDGIDGDDGSDGLIPVSAVYNNGSVSAPIDVNTSGTSMHITFSIIGGTYTGTFAALGGSSVSGGFITFGIANGAILVLNAPAGHRILYKGVKRTTITFKGNNVSGLVIVPQYHATDPLFKVVGEVSVLSNPLHVSYARAITVDYVNFQNVSSKVYGTFQLDLTSMYFSRPRIHYNFRARSDSNGREDIIVELQRSTDPAFGSYSIQKSVTYRIEQAAFVDCAIEHLDINASTTIQYYRVVATVITGINASFSNDCDYVAHLIPFYNE